MIQTEEQEDMAVQDYKQYEILVTTYDDKEVLGTFILENRPTLPDALKLIEETIDRKIEKIKYLSIQEL